MPTLVSNFSYPSEVTVLQKVFLHLFYIQGINMQTQDQTQNQKLIQAEAQTIDLDTPVKMGDLEIKQLEIRKPNVQALQGVKIADLLQGDVNSICTILPRISSPTLTKAEINQLEPSDIAQVAGVVMIFLQTKSVRAQLLQQQ